MWPTWYIHYREALNPRSPLVRSCQLKTGKTLFMSLSRTITGWTGCGLCVLRGRKTFKAHQSTAINHLSVLYSFVLTSLTPGHSRAFWAVICFITRDAGIRAQKEDAASLTEVSQLDTTVYGHHEVCIHYVWVGVHVRTSQLTLAVTFFCANDHSLFAFKDVFLCTVYS